MTATFERFSLDLTLSQAKDASHPGPCDGDVAYLVDLPKVRRQLSRISDSDLANELKEYGAWDDDELSDRRENEARIVWIAAGNIVDDHHLKGN